MEENVQKELEVLQRMVLTWKRDYLGWAPSDGGGDFLAQEFREEIETHVYPYIRRLSECEHLSGAETKEFLDFCYRQVEDLRNTARAARVQPIPGEGG